MFDESAIFIEMPVLVKSRQDGDRRLVEVEASNEVVDSEGDVILQQALLGSADSFLKSGHLDIDHLSEIGDRLGVQNPSSYIVGNPVEVKDLGGGRTSVVGELHKAGRQKADELWESLKADPPVRWRASIYGFPLPGQLIDCRVTKAGNLYGASRFLVKGLDWRSLAFTRNPINTAITGSATVVTAKSYLAIMKSRMPGFQGIGSTGQQIPLLEVPNYIISPRDPEEMAGHFFHHIAKGHCPCINGTSGYSSSRFAQHFEVCCGESAFDAAIKGGAMMDLLRKDRRVQFYPFNKSQLNGTGNTRTILPVPNKRYETNMTKMTDDLSLIEKFTAFLKGSSHGGVPGSDKLEGIKVVEDIFNEPNGEHSAPSRGEIVTGPAEASSGGGAVRMTGRYSDPAPQAGLVALYDRLDGIMREFQKSHGEINARIGRHERAMGALISLVGDIGKAQTAATTKSVEPVNEDSFLGKADQKLAKARKALRKAEMEEDDKKDEERKADLTAILDTLKSAIRLLAKAEEEDEADEEKMEKSLKLARTLQDQVKKSIEVITKAEEEAAKKEEEREAAEKAKAEAAAKAVADAAAEAAKKSESESSEKEEKEEDTARKSAAMAEVEKALNGLALEVTTVKGVMETLMTASRGVATPPAFVKGEQSSISIQQRIDEARDNGALSDADGIVAQSLMQRKTLAAAGRIPVEQVARDIAAAPAAVRELFQAAA
jgi:hypothetical protein